MKHPDSTQQQTIHQANQNLFLKIDLKNKYSDNPMIRISKIVSF